MMPPNNVQPKQTTAENNQSSGSKKASLANPQEQELNCPRCDSPNTKFCYYNNYSLTQPRHFCKTCRRYWTKGGALRNVPIGGGSRKNKKARSSSRLLSDSKDSSGPSEISGYKFFHGISQAMDFNVGGLSFPRLNPPPGGMYNHFSSFCDLPATSAAAARVNPSFFTLDPSGSSAVSLLGFNYSLPSVPSGFSRVVQEMGSGLVNANTSLAYSIESLSSINQDLHWKMQQQRLAILLGGDNQNDSSVSSAPVDKQAQKPQPILFQNLNISKPEVSCGAANSRKEDASSGDTASEWLFGNPNGQVATATRDGIDRNDNDNTTSWNGVQAWGDFHSFHALP